MEENIGPERQSGDKVIRQKPMRAKKDRIKHKSRIRTRDRRSIDTGDTPSVKLLNRRRQRRPTKKILTQQNTKPMDQETKQQAETPSVRTSSSLQQLVNPNPNINCTPGWCLVYVRETFGIGPKYPSATANWNASQHKHADQNFPAGIWVPIWFSLSDNPHGHVALRQPDGSIWSSSSPTSERPIQHPSLQDIISYYGNKLTYLGWTEDIEDVMVMSGYTQAASQPAANAIVAGPILAKPQPGL